MNLRIANILLCLVLQVSLQISWGSEKKETASSARDFLNTLGVCVHVQHGEDPIKIAPLLRYVGVQNVRDAADRNYDMSGLIYLHKESGVKVVIGPGSGARDADLPATLDMARKLHKAGALLAIEGPNEPNNFGGVTYQGEKSGKTEGTWMPVAQFQRDFYRQVKADVALKRYPVFSASEMGAQTDNCGLQFLEIPDGAETLMPVGTRYADYANVHNYLYHPAWPGRHDNQVWLASDPTSACRIDGLYGNHGKTWQNKFDGYTEEELKSLPKVTTETGVRVGDCNGEITEEIQGKNILNCYLSQFKQGWSYTFIYVFIDDPDGAFGFYKNDYRTARQSAHYLHNLTTILADKKWPRRLGTLSYEIEGASGCVHDLLLQKSNGNYYLMVWGDRASGSERVKVKLSNPYHYIRVYDPTQGVDVVKEQSQADALTLEVSNHPFIIEIEK